MIIKCALKVHSHLGCGFLESIYENALILECKANDLNVLNQQPVRIFFRNEMVGNHKLDLLVNERVIVELKAVKAFENIHCAQLLHYLKATRKEVGLLLNFGRESLEIKRMVL